MIHNNGSFPASFQIYYKLEREGSHSLTQKQTLQSKIVLISQLTFKKNE